MEPTDPPPDGAFTPGGLDPAVVRAELVAATVPGVDVIVVPAPRPSGRPEPAPDEAEANIEVAVATARKALLAVVADVRSGATDAADPVTSRWRPTGATDIVTAEAATRLATDHGAETIVERLRRHGWNVEIREIGGGNVRLVGAGRVARRPVGLDIGMWFDQAAVTLRTLVPGVHVGTERAAELVEAGDR